MKKSEFRAEWLVVVFILGCILFGYPLVSISNTGLFFRNIPILFIYIFCAWLFLIILTAVIMLGARNMQTNNHEQDNTENGI